MTVKLSQRLLTIAHQVPAGSKVADIGSDHALLPTYLVQSGKVHYAVAGEVNKGPYEAAKKQVEDARLEQMIAVRQGDGLSVLEAGEVDTITIAGMGGSLIVSILSALPEKLKGVQTLVLQPNVAEDQVRQWLRDNGWFLTDEHILEEDKKIYEVLTAVKKDHADTHNANLYDESRELPCGLRLTPEQVISFGPYLIRKADAVFMSKWEHELDKLNRIQGTVEQSKLESSKKKAEELAAQIQGIGEVLACLRKGRL
ncbi:SAM-dependent methyltransferase [Paenibacillus swuensis]|uniref:SAM-dependent methyltransferase n=1 Tax=Paenibacillus swuensis TaxID=1178515 RepID=A0A172TK26_9BACL|nr:class I SAM-dependent methyltransferase [Paenibacillus swuensis]ANE47332.1 SAM-dependent methyltransferase [Paenibacillus swuensis]